MTAVNLPSWLNNVFRINSATVAQRKAPKILLAERNPVRFLAGFIAACAAGCPVFLCNPNWVRQEWQQVLELVQPDLILGYGDWGLAVRDYYPNPQPNSSPKWIMIPTGGSSGQFCHPHLGNLDGICARFSAIFPTKPSKFIVCIAAVSRQRFDAILRSFTTGGSLVILPFKQLSDGQMCNIDLNFSYL